MTNRPTAVLSVDLELFSHTPAYRQASETVENEGVGTDGIDFLQQEFASREIESTWFVVSDVATAVPDRIAELAAEGHEIGSHTVTHRLLGDLDEAARTAEIANSKAQLESVTGKKVKGFRAPAFSFGEDHFDALAAAGYEYDSSVVASRRIPGWYGGEYSLNRPAAASAVSPSNPNSIAELPVSVMPGVRLPLTGTWLRFFGPWYTILGMKLLARRGISPILYVHPWEFVELPQLEGVPKRVYYHTGEWMRRAVRRILETDFEFTSARSVLQESGLEGTPSRAESSERAQ